MRALLARSGGGKSQLREQICRFFPPPGTFGTYVEPFCGVGWVALNSPKRADCVEIWNDIDTELINFLTRVRDNPAGVIQNVIQTCDKEIFTLQKEKLLDPAVNADERAGAYYSVIRRSYSSNGASFAPARSQPLNLQSLQRRFEAFSARCESTLFFNEDFEKIITRFDSPSTFFYIDPPYYNCSESVSHGFRNPDFDRLFACVKKIKGKFLLSFNDCGRVMREMRGYEFEELERFNNLNSRYKNKTQNYYELLFRNF
jgi:DNA adenine methylase